MFIHDKPRIPLVWKSLASNLNRRHKFKLAYYEEAPKEFLSQFNLDLYEPPFLISFGLTNSDSEKNKDYESKGEKKMEATFQRF